jgi:hypothetical protein
MPEIEKEPKPKIPAPKEVVPPKEEEPEKEVIPDEERPELDRKAKLLKKKEKEDAEKEKSKKISPRGRKTEPTPPAKPSVGKVEEPPEEDEEEPVAKKIEPLPKEEEDEFKKKLHKGDYEDETYESRVNEIAINKPKFGSVEWQDMMTNKVLSKYSRHEKLDELEKSFVEIQIQHIIRLTKEQGLAADLVAYLKNNGVDVTKLKEAKDKGFEKRVGDCYRLAGRYVLDRHDAILVHGTINGRRWTGIDFDNPHAWVEEGDECFDPVSEWRLPKEAFYELMQAQIHKKYTWEEAAKLMCRNKHWGPWHKQVGERVQDSVGETIKMLLEM